MPIPINIYNRGASKLNQHNEWIFEFLASKNIVMLNSLYIIGK